MSKEGDLKYTLYGVMVHHGWNTRSGHYYCFVRTSTGTWHSLDDNRVVSVGQQKVLEQKAYMLFYYRNLPPKKPAHVVQKEKMDANGLRNEMLLTSNRELKGTVQNGSFEKKISGANTSAAVTQRVTMNSISSETQLKEESLSIQKRHGPALAEGTSLNKDTQLESSLEPLKNHQGISVLNSHVGEILPLPQSATSIKGSGDNSQLDNASAVTTGTKTSECNGERSSSKPFSVSLTTQSNCNVDNNTATENVITVETSQKSNCVTSTGVPSVTPSRDDVEKSVKIDPIRSLNKPSNENNQKSSARNKANRMKQKMNHSSGTISFARMYWNMRDPETGQLPSRSKLWEETHFNKSTGTWVNDYSREVMEEVEKLKSQSQEEGFPTMTEDEMFAIVLGEKPSHICGLGAGPKPKSKQSHELLEKRAEELTAQVQSMLAQMQTEVQIQVQAEVAELKAQMQADMQAQMATFMEQVKKQMQQPPNPLL